MLQHEREYLSRVMAAKAFRREAETAAILHDIEDIDACLAHLPVRVEIP